MNELLKMILSLSLSGALLIFVLLLCKPLVKDKLSKRWQYYIWLVVVARLLLPFAPETNLMGMVFQHFDNTVIQTDTSPRPEQEPSALPETDFPKQYNAAGQVGSGIGEQLEPDKVAAPSIFEIVKQNIAVICLLVWLIVAIGLFIRKVTVYQSFVKYIKAGRIEISDMQLWEHVGKLVEQANIKRAVGLYTNSLISSPLLIGFFRPCIMLPTTELSESDFENTILHELTHYKRRDMFYKWLVQGTICFHWFNPFVYIMEREISKACELACDESVIREMTEKEKRAYGDTLIKALNTGGHYEDSLASVTLTKGVELLKERLDAIMSFRKKSKWGICFSLLLTVVLIFGFSFSGAYAANISPMVNPNPDIAVGGSYDGKTLYFVYTEKGLRSIGTGSYDLDKVYMLAGDINLSSDEWIPIGTVDNPFTGTFNGNGFYIKGLTMVNPNAQIVGLFGYAKGAKLHNIELRDTDISTAGANITEKKIDSICASPTDTTLTDNRVYEKVNSNPNEKAVMDTLDFRGKTYYLIFNEAQLRAIGTGEYGMDKNYMQQADIQMSTDEWVPIGTVDTPFTGSYQGNGYEIIGLTMTDPNAKIIGLFGVAENAHIYNITMRDYDIMSAGKNVSTKSIAPILVNGLGETRCYDNFVYPKE